MCTNANSAMLPHFLGIYSQQLHSILLIILDGKKCPIITCACLARPLTLRRQGQRELHATNQHRHRRRR